MTQQNETEQQGAGPEQPSAPPAAPAHPSPYLDAGQAVPQAYLAPPQAGQPRYGQPPAGPAGRPFGGGQQRLGQPPAARPAPTRAAAPGRDPAIAPAWYRLAASAIDWFIIILVSVIAFWSPLSRIWHQVEAIANQYYADPSSPTAQAAINGVRTNPANAHAVVYWLLAMFGFALVYFWVQQAAWGATVGKRALGVRVVRAADRSRIGFRQAGIRTVAFLAGPAILMLLITPVNFVGGLLWAADAGLPLFDLQAQSLHDKLAGTVVVRQRWLDQRSRGSQPW